MVLDEDKYKQNPYEKAGIISKLFFWWMNGFFRQGRKSKLETKDVYRVLPDDSSGTLGRELAHRWTDERRYCREQLALYPKNTKRRPSLGKVIVEQFYKQYMLMGTLAFIEECIIRIAQPLCIGFLIRYFNGKLSKMEGHLLAGGIVLTSILYTFTHHPFFFGVCHVGMQVRIACCSLIYRKALRLSQASLGQTNIGQLVNLLSNDVNRFDQSTIFLHYFWIGPLQTVIVTVILWMYFGPSCLVGVGFLILLIPFQGYMGKLFSDLRATTATRTDSRIRIMSEILGGMRVIKMYAWEKPFSIMVDEARKKEIKLIRTASYLRSVNVGIFYVSSKLIIFLTLLSYVFTGNALTAEKVFVALAMISNTKSVMTLFFPSAIAQIAEALVSIRRIEDFLLMDERGPLFLTLNNNDNIGGDGTGDNLDLEGPAHARVIMKEFYAKWNPKLDSDTLTDINLTIGPGELVCLIGHVGSGKGSMLHAILKELPASKGSVFVHGTVAYASQEPWVFAGTVRQNITFGCRYVNESWYNQVVEACALTKDFELFPLGDETAVGDRGSSLSGGQKARISLARAVFAERDVYLLDDPLSAVDAEVGRHLFDKCINGILKDKLRVLVTHQVQFLKPVGRIVLLNGGRIEAEGTYDEIIKSGKYFAQAAGNSQSSSASMSGSSSPGVIAATPQPGSSSRVNSGVFIRRRESGSPPDNSILGLVPPFSQLDLVQPGEPESDSTKSDTTEKDSEVELGDGDEGGASGSVKVKTYWEYFHAGSNCCTLSLFILSNVITQALFTGSDYYLQIWTRSEEALSRKTSNARNYSQKDVNTRNLHLIIYSAAIGVLILLSVWRVLVFLQITMSSSVNLHASMFQGIIRTPMRFFETNPVGRILNRFSKDIGQIDESLPMSFMDTIGILLTVLGVLIIIAVVNPILLIPAAILLVLFHFLRKYYMCTARQIKRIESIARSPVFSHLSTSLYGITTIRAFGAQEEFIKQFDKHQDLHSAAWFLFIASTRWFGVWLDWISIFYIASVTYSFMFELNLGTNDGAEVGFTISTVMMLTGMFQWGVRQSAEVENQMISVERILEYIKLEPEAALESKPGECPPKNWPWDGEIVLTNMSLQYGETRTLKDISCKINAAEKIGIVGRTGAGKSSLVNALFRLVEPSFYGPGDIRIDGLSILPIGLHDLRSKLSIIPQEPVLFEGTLRSNLDPFNNYTDADIWKVLKDVSLYQNIKQFSEGLDMEISEDGKNFSIGSKQLICIGRAILKQNKIIILDEATANVDSETDAFIQKTIRVMFKNCTVLTVAHRLNTVMDSDRILVLSSGSVVEFDEPWTLLQDKTSALYHLVEETGQASMSSLMRTAKQAWEKRDALKHLENVT